MDLDNPSNVAIVTCDYGTVLLRASASKRLLGDQKKRKAKAKKGGKKAAVDNSDESDSDEDSDEDTTAAKSTRKSKPKPKPKPAKSTAKGKGKANAAAGPSNASSPPRATVRPIKCRYRNGEVHSDVFLVTELVKYQGEPSNIQRNVLVWSEAAGSWRPLPDGMEPLIPADMEVVCECYRLHIGLE